MTNGTMSWARAEGGVVPPGSAKGFARASMAGAGAGGGVCARGVAGSAGAGFAVAGPGDAGLVVAGHASLFGVADLSRDVVEPGAFAKALALRGAAGMRMLFQHDPAQPVGVWTAMREDARGLWVEGRLTAGPGKAGELSALIADGALDGLSIGFRTVRARSDPRTRTRHILEADLWEVSIVTFPMLPGARLRTKSAGADERSAAWLAARLRHAASEIDGRTASR